MTRFSSLKTQTTHLAAQFGKGLRTSTEPLPSSPASPNEPTLRQLNEFAVSVGAIHEQAIQDMFMGQADEAIRRLGDATNQIELKLMDTTTPNFRLGLTVMLFDTLKALQDKLQTAMTQPANGIKCAQPSIDTPQKRERGVQLQERLEALQLELLRQGIVRN